MKEALRTDEELMAAYVAGDQAAFSELFDRYAAPLRRILARQLNRPEDARDLLQQTFLHLHRSRNDFRPDAALRPWLLTIALNLKRQHLRRLSRRSELGLDAAAGEVAPEHARPEEQRETIHNVRMALRELPEDQRKVIVLHWFDGLGFHAISAEVEASLSAVKVRAHRGYVAIREKLRPSGTRRDLPPSGPTKRSLRGLR